MRVKLSTNTFLPGRQHTVYVRALISDTSCDLKVYRRPDMKVLLAEHTETGEDGKAIWRRINQEISSGEFPVDITQGEPK